MSTYLLFSHITLWIAFILQSVLLLVLLRQVGMIYVRQGADRARMMAVGPDVGKVVDSIKFEDIGDPHWQTIIDSKMTKDLVLVFLSTRCMSCELLIPRYSGTNKGNRRRSQLGVDINN